MPSRGSFGHWAGECPLSRAALPLLWETALPQLQVGALESPEGWDGCDRPGLPKEAHGGHRHPHSSSQSS